MYLEGFKISRTFIVYSIKDLQVWNEEIIYNSIVCLKLDKFLK